MGTVQVDQQTDVLAPNAVVDLGDHIDAFHEIERRNNENGTFSHTTRRFRWELLYYLLDNAAAGPIVEVGSFNGGMTSLFGYVAGATGRLAYAVDIDRDRIART